MEIKSTTAGASAASAVSTELTSKLPFEISDDMVQAAISRSGDARELRDEIETRRHGGGCFSKREVESFIGRAHKHGKPGDRAVVMAYYAQKHGDVFAPESHAALSKFFGTIDWSALMADLKRFMEDLKAKEAEAQKAEQIKQDLLKDGIKRDDGKRQLVKDNGTKADRQRELRKTEAEKHEHKERIKDAAPGEIDEELTASGRLQLSDVERTKLGLMKKGFANKE